jgi:hypothetical protein
MSEGNDDPVQMEIDIADALFALQQLSEAVASVGKLQQKLTEFSIKANDIEANMMIRSGAAPDVSKLFELPDSNTKER